MRCGVIVQPLRVRSRVFGERSTGHPCPLYGQGDLADRLRKLKLPAGMDTTERQRQAKLHRNSLYR